MTKLQRKPMIIAIFGVICLFILAYAAINGLPKGLPNNIKEAPHPLLSIHGAPNRTLNRPLAVAVNKRNWIYVADSGNNQIQVFDAKGQFLNAFGQQHNSTWNLNTPYGITILPDESVLVSDMLNNRIMQYAAGGKFEKVFLPPTKGVKPGILLWQNNSLYVSDLAGNQVLVMNMDGQIIRSYHSSLSYPQGIALLSGKLVVADAGNSVLRIFGNSVSETLINGAKGGGQSFTILRGVAADNLNRILVADSGTSQVRFLDDKGENLLSIGGQGNGQAQFRYPSGVTVGLDGRIYVADWGNNRVQVWGYTAH